MSSNQEDFTSAWFSLLSGMRHMKAASVEGESHKVGCMSSSSMLLFHALLAHPGAHTAKRLVEITRLSAPSVSRAVDELTAKGYLQRKENPEDRRSALLSLSVEGEEKAAQRRSWMQEHTQSLYDGLSQEERDLATKVLPRMSEVMRTW